MQCVDEFVLLGFGEKASFDDDYTGDLLKEVLREHRSRMPCGSPRILVIKAIALPKHAVKLIQVQACDRQAR